MPPPFPPATSAGRGLGGGARGGGRGVPGGVRAGCGRPEEHEGAGGLAPGGTGRRIDAFLSDWGAPVVCPLPRQHAPTGPPVRRPRRRRTTRLLAVGIL